MVLLDCRIRPPYFWLRPRLAVLQTKEEPMTKAVVAVLAVAAALVAVESFYEHPTRGRGLRALLAVLQAGEAL